MASRAIASAAFENDRGSGANGNGNGYSWSRRQSKVMEATPGKATIMAIGRGVPGEPWSQEEILQQYLRNTRMDTNPSVVEKLERLGKMTGVKTRHFSFNSDADLKAHPEFVQPEVPSIRQRLLFSNEVVTKMLLEACEKAISEWGRPVADITHMVYVCSSEFRMPGGDLVLARALGLNTDVNRVMLYMLGCYGGATGLRVAKDLAENNPGSRVLLTTADTVIPGYRVPNPARPYDLVGAALFGEASSAVIIGADPVPAIERPWFEIDWAGQSFIPDSENVINGILTEAGILIDLGKELPTVLEKNVDDLCQTILKKSGKSNYGYDDLFWAVHPGGPAILNAVETRLNLSPLQLQTSRKVLEDFGNVNATTIIYVLDYMRKASLKRREANISGHPDDCEWGFILSFGPGITVEGALARNLV